jgi:hypothetical protein
VDKVDTAHVIAASAAGTYYMEQEKTGFEPSQKNWMQQPSMVELLMEAKTRLVQEGILDRHVLNRKDDAHDAYYQNSGGWRYLTAYLYGLH